MKLIRQNLDEILARLRPLDVDWRDETALRVVEALKRFPEKAHYQPEDLQALLNHHFDDALLLCRLFLGLSKDQFAANFKAVHPAGVGAKAFASDPAGILISNLRTHRSILPDSVRSRLVVCPILAHSRTLRRY